jgi:hypothetical protein
MKSRRKPHSVHFRHSSWFEEFVKLYGDPHAYAGSQFWILDVTNFAVAAIERTRAETLEEVERKGLDGVVLKWMD